MNPNWDWLPERKHHNDAEAEPPRPGHHDQHNLLDIIGDDLAIAGGFVKDCAVEAADMVIHNPAIAIESIFGGTATGLIAIALLPAEVPALGVAAVGLAGAAAFPVIVVAGGKAVNEIFFHGDLPF